MRLRLFVFVSACLSVCLVASAFLCLCVYLAENVFESSSSILECQLFCKCVQRCASVSQSRNAHAQSQ